MLPALLLLDGCDLSPVALRPHAPAALRGVATGPARLQGALPLPRIYCVVELGPRTVSCVDLPLAAGDPVGPAALVRDPDGTLRLGGQRANVTFAATGLRAAAGIATVDATVTNLIGQSLGTAGTTPDPRGVRLAFVSGPTTLVGLGAVALATVADSVGGMDGTMTVEGQALPYALLVPAPLAPRATSAARPLSFRVPANVQAFSFGVYVAAAVPAPDGWVGLSDAAGPAPTSPPPATAAFALNAGRTLTLGTTLWDAAGRAATGSPTAFGSSAPAVATVDAAGVVHALAVGTATITATSGALVGRATIAVVAANAPPPSDVTLTVDPARTFAISRYVYGVNALTEGGPATAGQAPWYGATPPSSATFNRAGGNRWSAYNWETNASNAGSDYNFQNDAYLSASTAPGAAVTARATATFARNAALLVTVPMLPYVANDVSGIALDTTTANRAARLAAHFVPNVASAGTPDGALPDPRDGRVVQDAFVAWLQGTFAAARPESQQLFYSLDNEPDLWHQTHAEVQSTLQTYDGFIATTLGFARAIKSAAPKALVFGPALATYTGLTTLGRWPSPDPRYGAQPFVDVYLDALRAADVAGGRRLVDVLDVHWYPEPGTTAGTVRNDYAVQDSAMVRARLQAPRSLWDPTYVEGSWVNQVTGGPIALLPRLRATIAAHYPGTKLAVTEYYYGRGGDISGGLAEADVLGIFGREGVYAAALWPEAGVWAAPYGGNGALAYAYALGALSLYRNFDGAGSAFGNVGYTATTTDPVGTSVYASNGASGQTLVLAINKTSTPLRTSVALPRVVRSARVYAISPGVPSPTRRPDVAAGPNGQIVYTMPASSASMLVLMP